MIFLPFLYKKPQDMNHIQQGHQALAVDLCSAFLGKETFFSNFCQYVAGEKKAMQKSHQSFPSDEAFLQKANVFLRIITIWVISMLQLKASSLQVQILAGGGIGEEGSFPFLPVCKSCFLLAAVTLMDLHSVKAPLFHDMNMILESIM